MTDKELSVIKYNVDNDLFIKEDAIKLLNEVERLNSRLDASRDVCSFLKEQLFLAEQSDNILMERIEVLTKSLEELTSNDMLDISDVARHIARKALDSNFE